MTTLVRLLLTLLPLAMYFAVLGALNSGRRPRVIPGPVDFGWLAFGLGGLIAFGPVGSLVVNAVFPRPNISAWLAMASLVGLLALMGAARARSRLVVYHVDGAKLTDAVGRAMASVAGPVASTVHGYEDVKARRGVTVEIGPILGWGVVAAYGENAEALIGALRPALIAQFDAAVPRRSRLSALWFGLSAGTVAAFWVAFALMTRPEIRAAVRRIGAG